ncbi:MAG: hypothetical protein OEL81_05100 [Nitrosopumilus sp.]|nr:hypothetical protein [Nitrosopumilus sp.]MDH3488368.1 hypothetical protein [Nitrosopumilus sp.]
MNSDFLRNPNRRFVLSLEYLILFLVIFYFVILFFSEYKTLGWEIPIVEIPQQLKEINGMVLYVMLSLLSFDLLLKYMKIRDWRLFLKKYWLDVAMVILIPIFSGVKILKAIKLAKKAKIAKYGFKAADKTQKKIRKKSTKK